MRSAPDPEAPRPRWPVAAPSAEREPQQDQPGSPRVRDTEVTWATFGYLGAIFLGPVIPLICYAITARRSPFLRFHTATALNLSLSWLLYELCCAIVGGLLALDSVTAALVIAGPLGFISWLIMLRNLLRGVSAANRDERYEIPGWICARLVG